MAESEPKKKTYTLRYFLFGMGISILVAVFSYTDVYIDLEHQTYDSRFIFRGNIYQDPNIGTVDIDDETYQSEGRMEDWQRKKHADLIETLGEWEVRMLGFDIFMPEPQASFIYKEDVEHEHREAYTAEDFLGLFEDHDQIVADAARKAGNVYFSGVFEISATSQDWDFVLNNMTERNDLKEEGYQALLEKNLFIDFPGAKDSTIPRTMDILPSLSLHTQASRGVGFVQPLYDDDGVARWFPLVLAYDGKVFPSLVLLMACDYFNVALQSIEIEPGKHVKFPQANMPDGQAKDFYIPIDERGAMLVNWAGRYEDTFTHYPYARLIKLRGTYQDAVALRDVKRLIQQKPDLLQDPDAFIMEAMSFNIGPPMSAMTAYQTVGLFGMFQGIIEEDEDVDGVAFFVEQGLPEDEIPPEMLEKFNELKYNMKMAKLLTATPEITLPQMAEMLGIVRLNIIEHGFYALKNLMDHGGIKPEHHPLVFFSEFHDGKELLPSDLKDKMLIYGLTATGTQDYAPVPVQGRYKMVGYHANALNTIITEQFLTRLDEEYLIIILLVLGAIMGLIIPRFGPISGAGVVFALLIVQLSAAYLLFVHAGLWIDIMAPVGVVFLSYLSISVNNYLIERKERAYIQDSFKMYLSPQVVDQIAGDPGKLQLGGTRRELTILFTDVAGFSTISENLSAEKLVDLLNDYLGDMTDIIMANKGTVDKYEGDLIMAFWGAPIEDPDHAMDACFTALLMNERLINMRAEFKAQGKPPFIANMDARIGLNTGDVVVGNMGSSQRFDYTVMGDHVNLASRLEGANKPYGTHIMISEFTYAKVKDHIEVRELDTIRVVGRDEPVTIYEVLAKTGEVDEKMGEIASLYQSAMEVYKDRGWNEAQEKFLKILTIDPNDGPSKTYVGRCEKYSVEPPLAEWDFVETMTEK